MYRKNSRFPMKAIAIILAVSLCAPIAAQAAMPDTVLPQASDYLAEYIAYICAMGGGDLEIWFEVTGTDIWADIGAMTIYLYESTDNSNFYCVKTFLFEDYENMLWHHSNFCMDYVPYEGVPGRYYKAYVQVWAGPEDGGEARYFWTSVARCI